MKSCPVEAFDCPYFEPHSGRCFLKNAETECDDYYYYNGNESEEEEND